MSARLTAIDMGRDFGSGGARRRRTATVVQQIDERLSIATAPRVTPFNTVGIYTGAELRTATTRPGCQDAFALPSRTSQVLRYPDGTTGEA